MVRLHRSDAKVVSQEEKFNLFGGRFIGKLLKVVFNKFNGDRAEVGRLVVERGDVIAVVIADEARGEVLLIEQLRVPALRVDSNGMVLELVAGVIDPGENGRDSAVRESMEESGYIVQGLLLVDEFFTSPGILSEYVFLYYVDVDKHRDQMGGGGGLASEKEDIRNHWLTREQVISMLERRQIKDAKTLAGLRWWVNAGK